jgi:hypothetical protein
LRARFITYGINTDLVNLGDAASKCSSVPGLRGSSRRAAMPCVRLGDVCADHPLGAGARAAHPLAHRTIVVARGNLSSVDRRREAALENPAAAQGRRGGCRGPRSARLVHAEPLAAPPVLGASFVQREVGHGCARRPQPYPVVTRAADPTYMVVVAARMRVRDLTGRNRLARTCTPVDLNQTPLTTDTSCIDRFFRTGLDCRQGVCL